MAVSPIQLTPQMDKATMVNAINRNFREVESENRTKIIKDEDGQQRVLIGRAPNGEYLIAVSAKGIDVLDALPQTM